jgi:hypothetical protein
VVVRFNDLGGLQNTDLQRAMLETFVTMHLSDQRMQGWTHVRCEIRGTSVRWLLLDADDDSVRREKDVQMGSDANAAMLSIARPFTAEQYWELCRISIRFSPPKMTIDVLTDTNIPVVTGELIDLHMEDQVRAQLALMMKGKS